MNKCKECARKDVRANYEANIEKYRAYDRKRGYRPGDPHKIAARMAVRKLKRQPCEVGVDCNGRIEAHHDDYTKPLEVRWLCKKHHAEVHTADETAAA